MMDTQVGRDTRLLLVRMGGLSSAAIEQFSNCLGGLLDRIADLDFELIAKRADFGELLFESVHGAPSDKRRALLALKRACFNNRELSSQQVAVEHFLSSSQKERFGEIVGLELQRATLHTAYLDAFQAVRKQEYGHVCQVLEEPLLRCGLAIGSSTVAEQADRLRASSVDRYGRRERRLASTLLRYISRSALKLSPFSTFTSVGVCLVGEDAEPPSLIGGPWSVHSVVRLRRHILDRFIGLLVSSNDFRDNVAVRLSNGAIKEPDGRMLIYRPARFLVSSQTGKFEFQGDALVRMRLSGDVKCRVVEILSRTSLLFRDLVDILEGESALEQRPAIVAHIDALLNAGAIEFRFPWSDTEPHLERTILEYLRSWNVPGLHKLTETLARLIGLQEGFLTSTQQPADYREMNRASAELLRLGAELTVGVHDEEDVKAPTERDIYQDVFRSSARDPHSAIMRIGPAPLLGALESVRPLVLYTHLLERRTDFLFSLGHLLEGLNGSNPTPVLEAFSVGQQLWRNFIRFEAENASPATKDLVFNPFNLAPLRELGAWRTSLRRHFEECRRETPSGVSIDLAQLALSLERVPKYLLRGYHGSCLFLQAADSNGSLWVQNGIKEGTGRCSSRFTSTMPAGMRHLYTEALTRRSDLEADGERVQLLDIYCAHGDTLNVHDVQTEKVLELPGRWLDAASSRKRTLSELSITLDCHGYPHVRDRDGQRYLPVHLGLSMLKFVPTIGRFLCAFGPSEMEMEVPTAKQQDINGVGLIPRVIAGNVVLGRKSWAVPAALLLPILDCLTESEALASLHRFRREHGIPARVFVSERVQHPVRGFYSKPQYLDLDSPLFVTLLSSIVARGQDSVRFVEMLPDLPDFLRDPDGRPWAIEYAVDAIGLRQLSGFPDRTALPQCSTSEVHAGAASGL